VWVEIRSQVGRARKCANRLSELVVQLISTINWYCLALQRMTTSRSSHLHLLYILGLLKYNTYNIKVNWFLKTTPVAVVSMIRPKDPIQLNSTINRCDWFWKKNSRNPVESDRNSDPTVWSLLRSDSTALKKIKCWIVALT